MADTHTEDYSKPDLFPQTETRHVSELFQRSRPVIAGIAAIKQALREAGPNEAVQVPPEAIDALLTERNQRHGEFTDDARTSQALKHVMREAKNWADLTFVQKEALDHIATKIGRILSGDPNHKDHWGDIQGYARLVETRL